MYDRFGGAVRDPAYGRFGFNGSLSDAPYGDFLLGLPFKSERSNPLVDRVRNVKEFGIFVTDTFKVTPKLTLDNGLRLDYFPSASYEDGLQYAWDPSSGNLIVPQGKLSAVSPLYPQNITIAEGNVLPEAKTSNVRPRLGFAYRLGDKTVVRAATEYLPKQSVILAACREAVLFRLLKRTLIRLRTGIRSLLSQMPFRQALRLPRFLLRVSALIPREPTTGRSTSTASAWNNRSLT